MKMRNWLRRTPFSVLLVALWFSACSDQAAEGLLGPDAAVFARGGVKENGGSRAGWGKGGKAADGTVVSEPATGNSWKLASQKVRKGETKSQAIIGAEGGYLYTGNHVLWVPRGAVDQPTDFKIQIFTPVSGDSAVAGVSLKATRVSETGDIIDVGEAGFLAPVILAVSYVDSDVTDPSATKLLWIKEPGIVEQVPNQFLSPDNKWVVGYLEHFSEYGIGWPNLTGTTSGLLF